MALARPNIIVKPFADDGSKNAIPIPTQVGVDPGAASFETGFPPATMIDISLGGIAPDGMDMNGILYSATEHIRFMNAGGQPIFNADLATEIGGYPVGVILQDDAGVNSYINILANNTTNFNTTPASIGVSWLLYSGGRLVGVRIFETPGTATYTPTLGTKFVIVDVVGGGGAGGSVAAAPPGTISAGGGGGGGAYAKVKLLSAFSGVTVTVGAAGIPAAAGGYQGGNGGASSFGSLVSCPGGVGGGGSLEQSTTIQGNVSPGGGGGAVPTITGTTIVSMKGETGNGGYIFAFTCQTGAGGGGPFGTKGYSFNANNNGVAAGGYGAGGSGGASLANSTAYQGGAGTPGKVIVWEYA